MTPGGEPALKREYLMASPAEHRTGRAIRALGLAVRAYVVNRADLLGVSAK